MMCPHGEPLGDYCGHCDCIAKAAPIGQEPLERIALALERIAQHLTQQPAAPRLCDRCGNSPATEALCKPCDDSGRIW